MGTQTTKNQYQSTPGLSPQSASLAKQAKLEMMKKGFVTTTCPYCKEVLKISATSNGERIIVSCKCRYVYDSEINFCATME